MIQIIDTLFDILHKHKEKPHDQNQDSLNDTDYSNEFVCIKILFSLYVLFDKRKIKCGFNFIQVINSRSRLVILQFKTLTI